MRWFPRISISTFKMASRSTPFVDRIRKASLARLSHKAKRMCSILVYSSFILPASAKAASSTVFAADDR